MCGEIDAEITRLEEQVKDLRELCDRQRRMLESIFEAWDKSLWEMGFIWQTGSGLDKIGNAITAARTASSMTGTSEQYERDDTEEDIAAGEAYARSQAEYRGAMTGTSER